MFKSTEGAEVVLMIRSRYQFSRAGRVTLRRDETMLLSVMVMMIIIQTGTKSPGSRIHASKIKNTHIFLPLLILSERYEIQYLEEHLIW